MNHSRTVLHSIVVIVLSVIYYTDAGAQDSRTDKAYSSGSPWVQTFQSGFVHLFDTDFDQGGGFTANRYYIQGGPGYRPSYDRSISLTVGYGYDDYDFSGYFDNYTSPWQEVHTLQLSAPVRWGNSGDLTFIGVPVMRFTAERTSDWDQGITGGGFVGISYQVNERLMIGPGIGLLSQLEDSATIFPIVLISWKITDRLILETGKGVAATQGPGLTLKLKLTDSLDVFWGGRYEKERFRLSAKGPVPDGIGEDSSFPFYCGVNYSVTKNIRAGIIGGITVGGQMSIEDRDGNQLAEEDYDSAPYLGVTVTGRF